MANIPDLALIRTSNNYLLDFLLLPVAVSYDILANAFLRWSFLYSNFFGIVEHCHDLDF